MTTGQICRSQSILTVETEDSVIALNVDSGLYHGLDGSAPRIWALLAEPTTPEAVVNALLADFDIDRDTCTAQVTAFLDGLRQRGLLTDLP
ncbi:PqqD family protein [Novispirillum itersonii]|uniref:PqqD family protein n=1 Tax=Novispirillum itersonii TaxID=189 RepID=A0A7X0DLR3_NOVIT|nr:PqqD family protein [Novispirillum itersonii]MBB6210255.1 hypothetical protein [Novispirillum itersonii]